MKKLFFFFIFIACFYNPAEAQNRRLVRADKAYEMRQYTEALDLYRKVYNKVNRKNRKEGTRIVFQQAMCYRHLNDPRRAETSFRRAIRANYPDPVAILYYADALAQNGKYEEALAQYRAYAEKQPEDWRGARGIKAVVKAQELLDNPGLYEVELERAFNSRANDFSPSIADHRNSTVIFTSTRDGALGKKKDPGTGQNFSSLFVSFLDRKGDWSTPSLLDEGPVNTEFNEGSPSVNQSGTELFFTRCQSVPNKDIGCRIWAATRQGANWGEPKVIELVSDSTISVGHPAISSDEMELYFISDMPGGQGGKDIWVASRERAGGSFRNPRNLGNVINTPGDEMFPYVSEDGILYFASNGHPGLGGFDIFFSRFEGGQWSEPENMGTPLNSPADDFGITFKRGQKAGYFSSNRQERGARGDAIFSFFLAPVEFTLQGTVRDDSTKRVIAGANIQLVGSDGSFAQTETSEQGEYFFDKNQLMQNTSYEVLVSKERYFNLRAHETTQGIVRSRGFVQDFYMLPIPRRPIELPEILYEFARWELLPQYRDSLNGLIETLVDNPNIVIELASHTDSRGTFEINDTLAQRRAQVVVDYLIERGIEPARLVATGYGKRVPRTITKDLVRDGFTFRAGTVLTEAYINALPSERHRDVAHQLNRRTEFRVLRDDYRPAAAPPQNRQP